MNVLITGSGGDIGQSLAKILKQADFVSKVIGTDIDLNNAGKFYFDKVYKVPRWNDSGYENSLESICEKEDISLVVPSSEPEIKAFIQFSVLENSPAFTVFANQEAQDIGFDKLKTVQFLEQQGLPFLKTNKIEEVDSISKKVVLKPTAGSGSKNVFVTDKEIDFQYVKRSYDNFIVQEYVEGPELTCGLFRSSTGLCRSILLERELMGDLTGKAITVVNGNISSFLEKIATGLNLVGSINVQMRIKDDVPYVFEINPRFSSTVFFRHLLGFHDLVWSIQDTIGKSVDSYNPVKKGIKIFRSYTEHIDYK